MTSPLRSEGTMKVCFEKIFLFYNNLTSLGATKRHLEEWGKGL